MSVKLIDTLKPKNNGTFPIVEAVDVAVTDELRLPAALDAKADASDLAETNAAVSEKANASDVAEATTGLQNQIDQIVISAGAEAVVAPEVAAARVGEDNVSYTTLKERLDTENIELRSGIADYATITGAGIGHFNHDGKYIALNTQTTDLTPASQEGFNYCIIDVTAGDIITVSTVGGNAARAYGFVDANGNILSAAGANITLSNAKLIAPTGAVKLVVNTTSAESSSVFKGVYIPDFEKSVSNRKKYSSEFKIPLIYASNQIISAQNSESVVFHVEAGKKYTFNITGSFNRFIVFSIEKIAAGAAATLIYSKSPYSLSNSETYEYTAQSTTYVGITVAYDYNNLSYSNYVSEEVPGAPWKIMGLSAYGKSDVDNLINSAITEAGFAVSSRAINLLDMQIFNGYMNAGIIYADDSSLMLYSPINTGMHYDVNVSGRFNRFVVAISNSVSAGGTYTILQNSGSGPFTNASFAFNHTGDEKYIIVYISYQYNESLTYTESVIESTGLESAWTINGVSLYDAEEIDYKLESAGAFPQYISANDVSVVATTTALYELYETLRSAHSDFVSRNYLGTDDFGNALYEYVFTTGDYNAQTVQRYIDSEIKKPVILLVTGVHGYERTSVMATYKFIKDLCEYSPNLLEIRENFTIKLIPCVNPWGFDHDTRWNGNGVNINRNFNVNWRPIGTPFTNDYSGEFPADQPETQIVQNWIEANSDAILYVDYHNSGYNNEVAYLAGCIGTEVEGIDDLKKLFLDAAYVHRSYLVEKCSFDTSLVFGYTGNFDKSAFSYYYADAKGLLSSCLECSWNQNGTGQHSNMSIKVGAEELGIMLAAFCEKEVQP